MKADNAATQPCSPFTPSQTYYDRGLIDEKRKKHRLSPLNETEIKKTSYGFSTNPIGKELRLDDPNLSA